MNRRDGVPGPSIRRFSDPGASPGDDPVGRASRRAVAYGGGDEGTTTRHVEVLCVEIGSTTTVVHALDGLSGRLDEPILVAQGSAATTVDTGDVRRGLNAALDDARRRLGVDHLTWDHAFAVSSAAGGLRMSVHGLVHDMTVKAAREAALGAGANVVLITTGDLRREDLQELTNVGPNIVLLAGGVDYGERERTLANARRLRDWYVTASRGPVRLPIIYAGNVENRAAVASIFADGPFDLRVTENVYPRIDTLNVGPARGVIQELFEAHITGAPGMEHVREIVDGAIMPVPGAVMHAAETLRRRVGDLVAVDVGGATTDVHSVCRDSPEVGRLLVAPEPEAKRTVEGDLGVYVNRTSLLRRITASGSRLRELTTHVGVEPPEVDAWIAALGPVPRASERQRLLLRELTYHAASIAVERHVGTFLDVYTMSGKRRVAEGKDLTGVQAVVGTGGALTRLGGGEEILRRLLTADTGGRRLLPPVETAIFIDTSYVMAAVGVLVDAYPRAIHLLETSIGWRPEDGRTETSRGEV